MKKTKTVEIKNGRGEVKGYITLHWSKTCGWVSIPEKED